MNFQKALKLLKEGKKIRRKFFAKGRYLFATTGCVIEIDGVGVYPFKIHDLEANDWEEYKIKENKQKRCPKCRGEMKEKRIGDVCIDCDYFKEIN